MWTVDSEKAMEVEIMWTVVISISLFFQGRKEVVDSSINHYVRVVFCDLFAR